MKRTLLAVVTVLTAASLGAAGAFFTDQAQVAENVIRAGSVAVSAEPTEAALSIDGLAPGTLATRPMTVVNDGTLPVAVVVTAAKKAGYADFYGSLTCKVSADGTAVYDGPMSTLRTSPVQIPAGSRSQMQFSVGLPESAGNDLSGDYAKFTMYVDAEQVR